MCGKLHECDRQLTRKETFKTRLKHFVDGNVNRLTIYNPDLFIDICILLLSQELYS